jgi:hypothetical protein
MEKSSKLAADVRELSTRSVSQLRVRENLFSTKLEKNPEK